MVFRSDGFSHAIVYSSHKRKHQHSCYIYMVSLQCAFACVVLICMTIWNAYYKFHKLTIYDFLHVLQPQTWKQTFVYTIDTCEVDPLCEHFHDSSRQMLMGIAFHNNCTNGYNLLFSRYSILLYYCCFPQMKYLSALLSLGLYFLIQISALFVSSECLRQCLALCHDRQIFQHFHGLVLKHSHKIHLLLHEYMKNSIYADTIISQDSTTITCNSKIFIML